VSKGKLVSYDLKNIMLHIFLGLLAKWKQPIFYDYDCNMTVDLLKTLLEELKSCGYCVVAIVSDLGGANRGLYNELGITEEKPW